MITRIFDHTCFILIREKEMRNTSKPWCSNGEIMVNFFPQNFLRHSVIFTTFRTITSTCDNNCDIAVRYDGAIHYTWIYITLCFVVDWSMPLWHNYVCFTYLKFYLLPTSESIADMHERIIYCEVVVSDFWFDSKWRSTQISRQAGGIIDAWARSILCHMVK